MKELFKRFDSRLILLIALAAGVALVLIPNKKEEAVSTQSGFSFDESVYSESLEKRLTALIEDIDGVGNVSVMITLEGSAVYTYATDTSYDSGTNGDSKRESTVVLSSGGSSRKDAVISGYSLPKVSGAAVVCSKELTPVLQAKVIGVASAALGISTSKIYVTN